MTTLRTLMTAALAATFAFAANNTGANHAQEIASRAVSIQKDAEWMSKHLKTRQIDRQQLEQHAQSVEENIAKLKELVAGLESDGAAKTDSLQLVKTKVQLLEIFHGKKKEILTQGDLSKNRGLLRAQADGIAKRAEMLQRTASQMN